MVLPIFTVTYASYNELYTETQVFLDEDKARACQKDNIYNILYDRNNEDWEKEYQLRCDDDYLMAKVNGFTYSTKLERKDYEFFFEPKR
jgi:hypothetical protein